MTGGCADGALYTSVNAGAGNPAISGPEESIDRATEFHVHPSFNPQNFHDNVALLHLPVPFNLSSAYSELSFCVS